MEQVDPYIYNKELNDAEIEAKKIILTSKPRMLMAVLTTRCNLSCIMCSRRLANTDATLPSGKIRELTRMFPYLTTVDWQGGEVFLIDYFKDLFLEAKNHPNLEQSIITNGLLINGEWLKLLAGSKVNITFSIDAVTEDTYEHIRRGAKFKQLLGNLQAIKQMNASNNDSVQLHINTVVMRSNYRQLHLFPDFCQRYGVKHLRFDFLRPEVAPEEDILTKPDIDTVNYLRIQLGDIEKHCRDLNIWFEYTFRPFLSTAEDTKAKEEGCLGETIEDTPAQRKLNCKLPWKKLCIDAAGNCSVRPDCLCERPVGNLMEQTIEEIWNSQIMQAYRSNIINGLTEGWCSKTCNDNAVDTHHLEGTKN